MAWVSLSNSSPSTAAAKMNCSPSYRHPNADWYIFRRVCSSVEWTKEESKRNSQFWGNISGYLSMKAVMQMFSSDSQQFCGAEQPSAHTVAHSVSTEEPALSEAAPWDLLWSFAMSHSLGLRRGASPQWPAAQRHLSRSTPVQPLNNYVPLLLITFSWSSPAVLCGEILPAPGVLKERCEELQFHSALISDAKMSCGACEGTFSGSSPFLQQLSSPLVIKSRYCVTWSRSSQIGGLEEQIAAGSVVSTSVRSISQSYYLQNRPWVVKCHT